MLFNQDNCFARARERAFATESAFNGYVGIRLLKHHIVGAYVHTNPAAGAGVRIHKKYPVFKLNGIFRAIVGTYPALVAQMDTVIARSRKAPFNTQH